MNTMFISVKNKYFLTFMPTFNQLFSVWGTQKYKLINKVPCVLHIPYLKI